VVVTENNEVSSVSFCLHKFSHQSLTWGTTLRSAKVIFSLFEKLWTEKYPSSRFNHLSMTSASILPSNIEISKFIYTLKGEVPPFEEDASPIGSHRRICTKLSIISFLYCVRASSINNLKGSLVLSSFFSPTMGGHLGVQELLSSRETSSRPNSLYSDLVGDMN
jgi:hypothetical protein